MPAIEYIHAIEGRLRIKVPEVRRSPQRARRVEELFRGIEGVREVRANPITGNVLFLHDPDRIAARVILGSLIAAGYLGMGDARVLPQPAAGEELADALARAVTGVVFRVWDGLPILNEPLERLVEALARFLFRLVLRGAAAARA